MKSYGRVFVVKYKPNYNNMSKFDIYDYQLIEVQYAMVGLFTNKNILLTLSKEELYQLYHELSDFINKKGGDQ